MVRWKARTRPSNLFTAHTARPATQSLLSNMKTAISSCCSLLLAATALALLLQTAQPRPIGEYKSVILGHNARRFLQLLSNGSVHATGAPSDLSAQWRVQSTGIHGSNRLENVLYKNHYLVYARVGDCQTLIGHDPSTTLEADQVLAACSAATSTAAEPTNQPTSSGDQTTTGEVVTQVPTTEPVSSTGASTEAVTGEVPTTGATEAETSTTAAPVVTESIWLFQSDSSNPIFTNLRLASEDCYLSFDRSGFPSLCEAQQSDLAARLIFDAIFVEDSDSL